MDLFSSIKDSKTEAISIPLAARIRPENFDEFVGQEHLAKPGKLLREAVESDQLFSMILWGPPGSGKTTLAKIIASKTGSELIHFSAVTATVADIKRVIELAAERLAAYNQRTILFIDEIHRFNKAQQDAFLPHVEQGTIILIGSTTENPSFEVIGPLLSRTRVFVLKELSPEQIKNLLKRALKDKKRGLGNYQIQVTNGVLDFIANSAAGDARVALNTLEVASNLASKKSGYKTITAEIAQEAIQNKRSYYDKKGDEHYNTISAYIKSLRGSDADAALYWLARMVEAGEDPEFIARRMVIFASEDIGNADPAALQVAVAAAQAVQFVGMPEAQINLAQATTYLATAEKSNSSYSALIEAKKDALQSQNLPVPAHLRNTPTPLLSKLGYAAGYKNPSLRSGTLSLRDKYPHKFDQHYIKQQYLPDKLKKRRYYFPSEQGEEAKIRQRVVRRVGI